MRIAHISDLHFCLKRKENNIEKTKGLIELALKNGAQHFVITGDISDNSDENAYSIFKEILKKYNLYSTDKTTVVIGNHDIFGGPQTAEDVLNFPQKCINTSYHKKVSQFVNHFQELFKNTIRLHNEIYFPFVKEFENIVLIGVNSIAEYSRVKNPFASNGYVPKFQRKMIDGLLSLQKIKGKTKIVLIHHHFYPKNIASHSSESTLWNKIENYTMKLRGKKKLLKLFAENNVRLVLHGHSHEMKEYFREGIRFVNSGGSVDDNMKGEASMFLIDVFPFDISTSIHSWASVVELKEEKLELITSLV